MTETQISPMRKRLVGIPILALLLGMQGVFAVMVAVVSLSLVTRIPFVFIILVIIGFVCLVLAWGLWTMKSWAFGATVVVQIVSIIYTLLNVVLMLPKKTFNATLENLLFPVIILLYLVIDKNVRRAFRR